VLRFEDDTGEIAMSIYEELALSLAAAMYLFMGEKLIVLTFG
jgi:hypothetical protein